MIVSLGLARRRVVVVGGGGVGTRRSRALVAEGADVLVVAPFASADIAAMASRGELEWRQRAVSRADIEGAWLVVAATDNPTANASITLWCEEQRTWCVNAADAEGTPARVAAQSTHGDVAIGVVSLGAADPRRAVRIRDALGRVIDEGDIDVRHVRAREGRVMLVGSGPGAEDLVTVRGMRALAEADVVVADRLGATMLLDRLSHDVEIIDVGKSPDHHPVPQHEINDLLVDRAKKGLTVVRLKGGDPFVFGRGGEEVHACVSAGVSVEVIPGITSAIAVPGLAGIPVTQRGVAATVVITSGHLGPDEATRAALAEGATVVALMAVGTMGDFMAAALDAGADPRTPVAIIECGSTPRERVTRATISDASLIADETGVKPPAVIVIGGVALDGLLASKVAATPRP
ncbi:uroporphyrinogen-III C-methyltransferase [Demequina lutea]|uniref:uroporphyrinogen-III C-methyltransferase n=1 Tax=Demequina lutea TaxID=431489 RepID=A0A7Z0CJQ7_9MICO|nr:uroporphyrinogen-III C-methyltransferase [Demequina lutea]NYI41027.1 uroporphyrin-III C-methyltransferase/precorrin-2 dehydrogenase/sirohydrochlorin ferrochelatase [Demequina lutea]